MADSVKATYSDINFRVLDKPEELVIDAESINQNILAIFQTPIGSKWFRPKIGSNVEKYLFEPIDETTSRNIRDEMISTLEDNSEFRVQFDEVLVIPDPSNAQYYVKITYSVPTLDNKYTFNFNLFK